MKVDYEKLESNWKTYLKLCDRLEDENLTSLLDSIGERLVVCPASPRTDQYNCEPGGLIQHSLDVTITMRKLNKSLGFNLPINSILKVGLLHDIGKVGDLENDNFIEQDSEWHREKLGQNYKYNEEIQKMSVSHRSLYLLQHYGINLTSDEWLAIQIAQGSHFEENRFYLGSEPTIALLLQMSKRSTVHMLTQA